MALTSAHDLAVPNLGMPRLHPVRRQTWGLRAGYLIDPDGTQLTLIEQRP
ncbi:hypothetical protein [Arthrobacter sp. YN]|nr:hypothetical protein [Arthrobacter sp. YN]